MYSGKKFSFNADKNTKLINERGVGLEQVAKLMKNGLVVDIIQHPNKEKYQIQKIAIVEINNYLYAVPFIETEDEVFLKTLYPSRKAKKKYL